MMSLSRVEDRKELNRLAKRARELKKEFINSEKVGVFKPISKTTEWMDRDYKQDLIEILDSFIRENDWL